MRERELKPEHPLRRAIAGWSLPMRERELKLRNGHLIFDKQKSLPMRERELKLGEVLQGLGLRSRSPCGSVN